MNILGLISQLIGIKTLRLTPIAADPSKWRPLVFGTYKLNITCKCFTNSSLVGVGAIVRDSSGFVSTAMENSFMGCGDMMQSHAVAVRDAVKFAYDTGFRRLVVEVSCLDLVLLIQSGSPCFASIGVLIEDICVWCPKF